MSPEHEAFMHSKFPEWGKANHLERKVMSQEKVLESNPLDEQVGGAHYKTMKIQPIEFIQENNLGFCEGNIVKYACRHAAKGGAEDLKKVIHYAQLLLAHKYGDHS
jgi:hypothetical protein